jgi:hypothetical protein
MIFLGPHFGAAKAAPFQNICILGSSGRALSGHVPFHAAKAAPFQDMFLLTQLKPRPFMGYVERQSLWNFHGCATDGRLMGQCLAQIDANKDYSFDWMNHHPATAVFRSE